MNMNKALQNLYHAVSNETTTKVNISKLLVDIHYAITGKESENKNNWSKIVNSMADNWPEGGGGGGSWTVLTEESVTTTEGVPSPSGNLAYNKAIDAETLRVTFNGETYECTRSDTGLLWAYGGIGPDGPDFSEYPFAILSVKAGDSVTLYTETAGTYNIKIEASQSGGSSDFSKAEVTFINSVSGKAYSVTIASCADNVEYGVSGTEVSNLLVIDSSTLTVPLYKGKAFIWAGNFDGVDTSVDPIIAGNISFDENLNAYVIEGNGLMTFAGNATP